MSKRPKKPQRGPKPAKPKVDHQIHQVRTAKGCVYKFTEKHHGPPKGDHACWLPTISRDTEFALFQGAETGGFDDEHANLYNVHREEEEYLEIGTRQELMAIFWNPHSASEWHGHPRWPVRVRGAFNRAGQNYKPPRSAIEKMVQNGRISQRDADRLLRGDYP